MDDSTERRGGKRKGAGRKPHDKLHLICSMYALPEHIKDLKMWGGGNLSAGFKWLMEVAKPFIRRKGD